MSQKFWHSSNFVKLSPDLFNDNPNRPRLEPLDILILSTLCTWTRIDNPEKGRYNWESLETWGKRFGTNKDTAARSFQRLGVLRLIGSYAIKHQGRTMPLRFVRIDKLGEWIDQDKHLGGWPLFVIEQNEKGEPQKRKYLLNDSAESTAILKSQKANLELTPKEVIEHDILGNLNSVSPRMIWACAKYCGLNPAQYYEMHPQVIERRAQSRKEAAGLKAERQKAKAKRAKTFDNMKMAMDAHNNRLNERDRVSDATIRREASNCLSHYEINQWQMSGGRHVASVEEVAGPWLNKVVTNINRAKANEKARQQEERKSRMSWANDLQRDYEEKYFRQSAKASANPDTIDIEHEEMG